MAGIEPAVRGMSGPEQKPFSTGLRAMLPMEDKRKIKPRLV
jgi:hypothetical protein